MQSGQDIYNNHCYFCHGYQGNAETVASTYLVPPPRDFTESPLTEGRMQTVVRNGKPGTAMMPFRGRLKDHEIQAVVAYIRQNFMLSTQFNTEYHTPENGWGNHQQYQAAFPFVIGTLSIKDDNGLTDNQRQGKKLYLSTCITCHEQKKNDPMVFEARPVSMPRAGYSHRKPARQEFSIDGQSSATPYAKHDRPPKVANLNLEQRRGETLFQENCAFCHAADGSGKNWIGQFLEPHARDLTDKRLHQRLSSDKLRAVIENGLEGSSMPAWRNVLNREEIDAVAAYVKRVFFKKVTSK